MADFPLVSVIVPTHNRPDFLQKTLKSIISQTYSELEIIVVSNGVNYHNKQVIEQLADKRLIYVDQENSGGPSGPRNHGIRLAKGKYVAFCDDDDLWMPGKVEKQVRALDFHHECGLCYTKMLRFDDKGEWTNSHEEGSADLKSLLYVNTIPISSVFIRKRLLDQFGAFSESDMVGNSEDYEFLLRHSLTTSFFYIDEYLIRYWSGRNRTTSVDDEFTIAKELKYLRSIFGCYSLTYKSKQMKITTLLFPIFFQMQNSLRRIVYNMCRYRWRVNTR